jgi:hypothetical protein
MKTATRPHPSHAQLGTPLKAKPCGCPNPVGDPREMTCILCGHQIGGVPLPSRYGYLRPDAFRDTAVTRKRPRHGGAQ